MVCRSSLDSLLDCSRVCDSRLTCSCSGPVSAGRIPVPVAPACFLAGLDAGVGLSEAHAGLAFAATGVTLRPVA